LKLLNKNIKKALCFIFVVVFLSGCFGCVNVATKNDIKSMQAELDVLTKSNYELKQRVDALEAAIGGVPSDTEETSATPVPVSTATPVPTVEGYALTADDICSRMRKNGMPISSFIRYTEKNDPEEYLGTDSGYSSRADFQDSNMVPEEKGIILVFDDVNSAMEYKTALRKKIENKEISDETIYQYDNVIMRLPKTFSSEQCLQYEDALRAVLSTFKN